MPYFCKSLKDVSFADMKDCFHLAFSDYAIPLQLTEEQLRAHLLASGAEKALSYGAFSENKMVGFILNSCGIYNGEQAVFDVGTGVIPAYRGKRVFTELFLFAQQELCKQGVKKYYLEVLQENHRAIQAYTKQGFVPVRELCVLRLSADGQNATDSAVSSAALQQFDFGKADHCIRVQPSFEHCTDVLQKNPQLYQVCYKQENEKITAFCVFSKDSGNAVQLGYADMRALQEVMQWLMARFSRIIMKNIDRRYPAVLEMLGSLGAVEVAGQLEMVKELNSCP